MSAWTYLLFSDQGYVYCGATTGIRKRLREHNSADNRCTFTRTKGKHWHLLTVRRFDTRKEAFDLERNLKKLPHQKIMWELQSFDRVCKLIARHRYAFTPQEWVSRRHQKLVKRVLPQFAE